MTDYVFFFKAFPTQDVKSLSWPRDTKLIAIDPPQSCACGGVDARCSTAYSCLWSSVGSLDGFLRRYAPSANLADGDRAAFAGFSASHGFLNPLLRDQENRSRISAVILFDATFGGGKTGYANAVRDAVAGRMLLVSLTSDNNGDVSWRPVWSDSGASDVSVDVPAPASILPAPEAVKRAGISAFYLLFGADLPHQNMGKVIASTLDAYLIPWWRGSFANVAQQINIEPVPTAPEKRNGDGALIVAGLLTFAGVLGAYWLATRKRVA